MISNSGTINQKGATVVLITIEKIQQLYSYLVLI